MNRHEKQAALLEAVEKRFTELEDGALPAAIPDAPRVLGQQLDLPPQEVVVLLRKLHRAGKIGLLDGPLSGVVIARSQSLLRPKLSTMRGGSQALRVEVQASQVSSADGQEPDTSSPDEQLLHTQVTLLTEQVEVLQRELTREQGRKQGVERKLGAANGRVGELETRLSEARGTIRELEQKVAKLQPEAERVPGLLERITGLENQTAMPKDLADTVARLTSIQ